MITRQFQRELEDTLYVHKTLPLHRENSLEAEFPCKKVLRSRALWNAEGGVMPVHSGLGSAEHVWRCV